MRTNPVLRQLGSYAIADIQQTAREMRDAGVPLVDFSIGDPREPTPAFIRQTLIDSVPEVSQYPTVKGLPQLRQAVAGYVDRRFGVSIDPETQVLPTRGSKEAVFSSPLAFVDRDSGDGVIWPTPGYPVYERGARLAGAIGDPVALQDDFVFRADMASDEAWRRAAMVWICTPHNPAGSVMPADEIAEFYRRAREVDAMLCSDECYIDLYDREPPSSALQVADSELRNLLVFFSLSKRSGMTGYRSGVIVGDAEAITLLRALRTGTGTAPTEFGQLASAAAWADDDHVAERREIFAQKRAIVSKGFADLGFPTVGSVAGLYVWVRVPDDLAVTTRLLEAGVVVSPGRAFGAGGEGHIRLALVPTLDECASAVEVVQKCLAEN
jgi:succinyldiaminopimelate transaminase